MSDFSQARGNVISWSETRPKWQREALRRLVMAKLSQQDIADLADLAVGEAAGTTMPFDPITSDHLPTEATGDIPVALRSISGVEHVNRLAADQELPLAPAGITLIYGDNGAGKSGYARILRQVCAVRGVPGQVLRNVLSGEDDEVPTARVDYQEGTDCRSHTWRAGADSLTSMKKIHFFDTQAAAHLLDKEGDTAFSPLVVTLVQDLAQACRKVEAELNDRIAASGRTAADLSKLGGNTAVSRAVETLGTKGCEELLGRLAKLSEKEVSRLGELGVLLEELRAGDPVTRARLHSARADQLQGVNVEQRAKRLFATVRQNDDAAARELAKRVTELQEAATAAANLVAGATLSGIGDQAWLRLWEAARTYSNAAAYHGNDFPHTGPGARCVLCQQTLPADTQQLFVSLEQFVKDTTAADLRAAREETDRVRRSLTDTISANLLEPGLLSALGEEYAELDAALVAASKAVCARGTFIVGLLSGEVPVDTPLPQDATVENEAVMARLRQGIETEQRQAAELENAGDPEAAKRLADEHEELSSRAALRTELENVLAEHHRRIVVGHLQAAKTYCKTNSVTAKQSELAKMLITDRLGALLVAELASLGVDRLELGVTPAPARVGVVPHRLAFTSSVRDTVKLSDVLSEGECRAVALAGFLIEVGLVDDGSAIVLDDPVSSLDHRFLSKVAERLVKEAANRQVVVFTHSLPFVHAVHRHSSHQAVCVLDVQVKRGLHGPGMCTLEAVGVGGVPQKRLKAHKKSVEDNEHLYAAGADAEWAEAAHHIASDLRATVERAVETVLLDDVISRFDRPVQTKRLARITVTDADHALIDAAMSDLSLWTSAHEEPAASNEPPPTPAQLKKLINDVEEWRQSVEWRKVTTREDRCPTEK
ncbi:AAA family ATPase [Amycolatopsis sp. NPDC059657]|uniref:AAA family ATPase n=1 Tax=Amycolatopsis sp. NPDC059657 TaxID=3346899 RepID=UPI00366B85A1